MSTLAIRREYTRTIETEGKTLREILRELQGEGYVQVLADELGLSRVNLTNYLLGKQSFGMITARRIIKVFPELRDLVVAELLGEGTESTDKLGA